MKKGVIILIMCCVLSGCAQSSEVLTRCEYTNEYGDRYLNSMRSKDDRVFYNELQSTIDYTDMVQSNELSMETIRDYYDKLKDKYASVTGIEYTYEINSNQVKDTLKVDYTVVSNESIRLLDLADVKDNEFISLEKSIQNLSEVGYVCETH